MALNDIDRTADEFVCDAPNDSAIPESYWTDLKYVAVGLIFGLALVKGEIVSWYRIQAMFRFEEFHMYGIIGSAIAVGMLSVWLIRRFDVKTIQGEEVHIEPKPFIKGQLLGGFLFGMGWAVTGACPGPLYAQLGAGAWAAAITLLSAIAGTWVYGRVRDRMW